MLADPFAAILAHLDEAGSHTEQVYQLEKSGALADPANAEARALVIQQTARGAALLRDLAHTAWIRSGEPPVSDPGGNPIVPAHPRYNPRPAPRRHTSRRAETLHWKAAPNPPPFHVLSTVDELEQAIAGSRPSPL